MRRAAGVLSLLCAVFCAEAFAGFGEPVSSDSLTRRQRQEMIKEVSKNYSLKEMSNLTVEKKLHTVLERIPDRELKLLARNGNEALSGGTMLGEAIVGIIIIAILVGGLGLFLIVLGVAALFARGPMSSSYPPMRRVQYERQRRRTGDRKRLREKFE